MFRLKTNRHLIGAVCVTTGLVLTVLSSAAVPAFADSGAKIQPLQCGKAKSTVHQVHNNLVAIDKKHEIEAAVEAEGGKAGWHVTNLPYKQLTDYQGYYPDKRGIAMSIYFKDFDNSRNNVIVRTKFKPHASPGFVTTEVPLKSMKMQPVYKEWADGWTEARPTLEQLWGSNSGVPNVESCSLVLTKPGKIRLGGMEFMVIVPNYGADVTTPTRIDLTPATCDDLK